MVRAWRPPVFGLKPWSESLLPRSEGTSRSIEHLTSLLRGSTSCAVRRISEGFGVSLVAAPGLMDNRTIGVAFGSPVTTLGIGQSRGSLGPRLASRGYNPFEPPLSRSEDHPLRRYATPHKHYVCDGCSRQARSHLLRSFTDGLIGSGPLGAIRVFGRKKEPLRLRAAKVRQRLKGSGFIGFRVGPCLTGLRVQGSGLLRV